MNRKQGGWGWREFGLAWLVISLAVSLEIWFIGHDIYLVIVFLGLFSIIVFLMGWRAEAQRMKATSTGERRV